MTRSRTLAAVALAAAAFAAGAAQAVPVLNDTFDTENGGVSASPYTGWANFQVLAGSIGLIANGAAGIQCAGNTGACVNLDASRGTGFETDFQTSAGYAYGVGSVVTLSFDIAGHQVECCTLDDTYAAGFFFGASGNTLDHLTIDGHDEGTVIDDTDTITFSDGGAVPRNSPWTTHTISFVATSAGVIDAKFTSGSDDGLGPLLDNVNLDITGGGVPERASWALMISGFGLAGATLRRRRCVAAAA